MDIKKFLNTLGCGIAIMYGLMFFLLINTDITKYIFDSGDLIFLIFLLGFSLYKSTEK